MKSPLTNFGKGERKSKDIKDIKDGLKINTINNNSRSTSNMAKAVRRRVSHNSSCNILTLKMAVMLALTATQTSAFHDASSEMGK